MKYLISILCKVHINLLGDGTWQGRLYVGGEGTGS